MAAACCPPGSWPALAAPANYVPRGTVSILSNNLLAYVALPPPPSGDSALAAAPRRGVLILPEASVGPLNPKPYNLNPKT